MLLSLFSPGNLLSSLIDEINSEACSLTVGSLTSTGFSTLLLISTSMFNLLQRIIIFAYILGVIGEYTIVDRFAGAVFGTFGVTRFHFVPAVLDGLVIVPAVVLGIGLIAMRVCLIKVKGINLWNIRED